MCRSRFAILLLQVSNHRFWILSENKTWAVDANAFRVRNVKAGEANANGSSLRLRVNKNQSLLPRYPFSVSG